MSVYRTAAQLSQAIAALAGAAPTLCETFTLAQPSVEGAAISGLHIHAGDAKGNRNGVLLLGGVHARELMNPEAIVDLAADLLISYAQDADITYAVPGSGALGGERDPGDARVAGHLDGPVQQPRRPRLRPVHRRYVAQESPARKGLVQ